MCCSVWQCVAVKCDVLQCAASATRYMEAVLKENSALQHVAVSSRIGVLQHVAVCCGVLLTHGYRAPGRHNRTLHANECNTLCNTLQHTATHCNTLQHTAMRIGYMQMNAISVYVAQNQVALFE